MVFKVGPMNHSPNWKWEQGYLLFGHGIVASAAIAALPILAVLLLLGVFRKAAWIAGTVGLITALIVAIAGYRMPPTLALSSAAYGAAFGIFPISWIVFSAILLFRISTETGQFAILRGSIGRLTLDPPLQALLIAFAFGAFIEGAAGFGTPVAIAAAMLTGLGFSPFRASALCLVANTAPVAFGSIGIPVITLAGTTGLTLAPLSAWVGRMCAPMSLILPAYLIFSTGGMVALRSAWLPVVVTGVTFAGTQFTVSNYMGPQLTDILASLAAMAALFVMCRFGVVKTMPVVAENRFRGTHEQFPLEKQAKVARGSVARAWSPYGLLVIFVVLWGVKPIQAALSRVNITFAWPLLHDLVIKTPPISATPRPYHAMFLLNWLAASGTACMMAALLSALLLGVKPKEFLRMLREVARQLVIPTITVTSVLAMAFLMNYSGATATLGLAFAATGVLFPFFSALLGWLGVFLTGSDTSSNALFGSLQVVTAGRLGLNPFMMAAANSVGGVMGKMISLQTIAVAAAATGMSVRDQARLFRFTLKHSILLAGVVGLLSLLYAYKLHL
jgi:L-lactate transport